MPQTAVPPPAADTLQDPYLWLEDVDGDRALAWVHQRNAETEALLEAEPGYDAMRRGILDVLDSKDRIPDVRRRGDALYNFWQDAEHPRGLWRRTTLAEYRKPQPAWETLLDVDALGRDEGVNWVWSGAECLGPAYERCLVQLSRGGADATVVREFDLRTRRFARAGFDLPEAKTSVEWLDADTVYVATDFGPGTLTDSGYPRLVKRWRRGQPLADAVTVYQAPPDHVSAFVSVDPTPGHERTVVGSHVDFYRSQLALLDAEGRALPIDKPDDARLHFHRDRVFIELRSDWTVAGTTWPRGSLLVADAAWLRGERSPGSLTALFTPTPTRSLAAVAHGRRTVWLTVSDNVASRVEEWTEAAPDDEDGDDDGGAGEAMGRWQRRDVRTPFPGTLSVDALEDPLVADDALGDAYLLHATDFLAPDSVQLARAGSDEREPLKSRPAFFDAAGMRVEQRHARSRDGTAVPYFVVWPAGARADGDNPTLLYGYGGFEHALLPWYSGSIGRVWTGRGGVFVVANIRGGGEFGPAWHQAAVKAGKQKSYDDFAAVAADLVAGGVTRPGRLGIEGGSNGGLLVGAVMLQVPELLGAVVCQVPLLDMRRYHRLLAGASWMAEYGDPDDPAQWAWIERYSPYQNVRPGVQLPPVLFTTSTRDDRVHPGHARKMAARMREQGHRAWLWENIEGGHGGAADNAQRARMMALEYAFLWRELGARR